MHRYEGNWMENRQVGQMARRMNRRWPRGIGIVFPVFVGALAVFPLTWVIEQIGDDKPNWLPTIIGAGSAAIAVGVYSLALHSRRRWQHKNGSLVYVGAQYGADLDLERVKHCVELASKRGSPFEEPLRYRSDSIVPSESPYLTAKTLHRNFEFLFRSDNDRSPTGVIANLPWPFAVRYGYDLASSGYPEVFIWHLRDNRYRDAETPNGHGWPLSSRWVGNDLQDVIRTTSLKPPYETDSPIEGSKTNVLAIEISGPLATDHLLDEATLLRHKPESRNNIHRSPWDQSDEQWFHDCSRFERFACEIAAALDTALRQEDHSEVYVAARMPKPVALAVGFALFQREATLPLAGERPFDKLVFYDYVPAQARFNRVSFREPTMDTSSELPVATPTKLGHHPIVKFVNLTSALVRIGTPPTLEIAPDYNPLTVSANSDFANRNSTLRSDCERSRYVPTNETLTIRKILPSEILNGLPEAVSGVRYIVSPAVAACSDRSDLVFPLDDLSVLGGETNEPGRLGRFESHREGK